MSHSNSQILQTDVGFSVLDLLQHSICFQCAIRFGGYDDPFPDDWQ